MATLFQRQYARRPEAVSRTEQVIGLLILLLTAGLVAVFIAQVATEQGQLFAVDEEAYAAEIPSHISLPAEFTLPDPGMAGWRPPERVERFTAENLYLKINGRDEVYHKFGVIKLTFGRYTCDGDSGRAVDVYWYDLGSPANARGVYEFEAAPGVTPVSVGDAAYQVGGAVFFHLGADYVQVLPSRLDDEDAQVALAIARTLAAHIGEQ